MAVDVEKLAELYRQGEFKSWLQTHSPGHMRYIEDTLKKNLTESIFHNAIVKVYDDLIESDNQDKFVNYIKDHGELILEDEDTVNLPTNARIMVGPTKDPNQVFSAYNPNLLRYPMQIMFYSDDEDELAEAVSDSLARYPDSEALILDEFAYIEYFPDSLKGTRKSVPKSNWEIIKFKDANQRYGREDTNAVQSK